MQEWLGRYTVEHRRFGPCRVGIPDCWAPSRFDGSTPGESPPVKILRSGVWVDTLHRVRVRIGGSGLRGTLKSIDLLEFCTAIVIATWAP